MSEPENSPNLSAAESPLRPAAELQPSSDGPSQVNGQVAMESVQTEPVVDVEGLPEWEPLSPELVEDEAVRGDFMLRWAVVFLALLMGCRQIVESTTLVHVKTGQYLQAHGWLPAGNEIFSSTATEHTWINLSWMWDICASVLFSMGNGAGLSLATALIVATTWWLLGRITLAGAPTWWGSILGVMSLLACHVQFSGQPETLTLLGVAVTLGVLHAWRYGRVSLWYLPLAFAIWSNLDARLYFGLAVLLLWGIGDAIGGVLGRVSVSGSQRRQFWIVTAACFGASLLNPFGWHSLLSPVSLYGTEYPNLLTYAGAFPTVEELGFASLFSGAVWEPVRLPTVMGAIIVVLAIVALVLNRRRSNVGDVLLILGSVGFAAMASRDLAIAALIATVLGTLNAQEWYQATFRQTYSVELRELLFSRGGRAITVVAFFVLAVMAVNQQLFGVTEKRVGIGLSQELESTINGYREAIKDSLDDRPFNLVPRQGDLLIWVDQKPFVDSRVATFATGPKNLVELHLQTRRALASVAAAQTNPTPVNSDVTTQSAGWKGVFDEYKITHVLPRLLGALPTTYLNLLSSPDWKLTHLGAHCAVFYRSDLPSKEQREFLASREVDFAKQAREELPLATMRPDFPRPRTWFQKYVSPPASRLSNSVREADNLMIHIRSMMGGTLRIDDVHAAAIAVQAIRKANAGLSDVIDQGLAFEVLGDAYSFLGILESGIMRNTNQRYVDTLRFNQAVGAYYQAIRLQPNSIRLRSQFIELLQRQNRIDLVLREGQELDRLLEDVDSSDAASMDFLGQQLQLREKCLSQVEEVREKIVKVLETGESLSAVALQVYQAGFTLEALKLLESDPIEVKESQQSQVLQAWLRFESGRLEEAYNFFEFETDRIPTAWRLPASWTKLGRGEYDRAADLWKQEMESAQQQTMISLLSTSPLCQSPFHLSGQPSVWPVQHFANVADAEFRWQEEASTMVWYTAMANLESGRTRLAAKMLEGLLEANPETVLRPVIRFYLFLLSEKLVDVEPPSEWIPITSDLFVPDDEQEPSKSLGTKPQ